MQTLRTIIPKLKHRMNRPHLRYNERVHHNGSIMRAIEATGILNTQGQLQLDMPRPQAKPSRVRIIMLISDDDDLNPGEWENAIATNPSFDFLHDPEEDIYTLEDGKPVICTHHQSHSKHSTDYRHSASAPTS